MAEPHHSILEERKDFMVPPSGGDPTRRVGHFLRPCAGVGGSLSFPPPLSSSPAPAIGSREWAKRITFHGWRCEEEEWRKWVESLHSSHHSLWKKAGIYDAIMGSTYVIRRDEDVVYEVAAKWCPETNTFVFPWGEATVTLEDVTILGGFSVLGESVSAALQEEELVEVEERLIRERRVVSSRCTARNKSFRRIWTARFMGTGSNLEHEAFLSLWLSLFVLPAKPDSAVQKHVFPTAIRLARGTPVALAPAVLASIYRDLSLLREALFFPGKTKNFPGVSILAPIQIVQVWVWERFPALRPSPKPILSGEPRVARWHKTEGSGAAENVGLALDTAGASFQWQPYVRAVDNWDFQGVHGERENWVLMDSNSDPDLLSFARFLRVCKLVSVDGCMEWYFPHRVAMQFGMDQDLPDCVLPKCSDESPEIAWRSYSKPINGVLYVPSRSFDSDVTLRYLEWWQSSSVKMEEANAASPSACAFKQGDEMMVGEMLKSQETIGGDKPASEDGKPSLPGCQVRSPSSSAPMVGDMNDETETITSDSIEIPGLELEARICKLESAVATLKAATFGNRFEKKRPINFGFHRPALVLP